MKIKIMLNEEFSVLIIVAASSMVVTSSQKSTGLPQIRRPTPRLAKTRSAQNMKLMALGSKNSSSCNTLKSKEKTTDKTADEHSAASKVVSCNFRYIKEQKYSTRLNYM